jgi:hypothetical protein
MAKGNPYLMMGYGGIKRPGPPTPRLPSGQDLVNKIRGNASLRRKKKKKTRYG